MFDHDGDRRRGAGLKLETPLGRPEIDVQAETALETDEDARFRRQFKFALENAELKQKRDALALEIGRLLIENVGLKREIDALRQNWQKCALALAASRENYNELAERVFRRPWGEHRGGLPLDVFGTEMEPGTPVPPAQREKIIFRGREVYEDSQIIVPRALSKWTRRVAGYLFGPFGDESLLGFEMVVKRDPQEFIPDHGPVGPYNCTFDGCSLDYSGTTAPASTLTYVSQPSQIVSGGLPSGSLNAGCSPLLVVNPQTVKMMRACGSVVSVTNLGPA